MTLNLWRVVLTLVIAAHGIGHLFFLVPVSYTHLTLPTIYSV